MESVVPAGEFLFVKCERFNPWTPRALAINGLCAG